MAVYITASVGKNGKNQFQDVVNMQNMLNGFIIHGHMKPIAMLAADGMVGSKTITAIKTFQMLYVGLKYPDGRIDPGGQTLNALNGGVKPPPFDARSAGATREWAIALRSIKSGAAEFSLMNRATAEIKKLVVRNSAIAAIAVDKSFRESWVTVTTFLETNFDKIHGAQASFSKTSQSSFYMNIGGFTFPVLPVPEPYFRSRCPVTPPPSHGMMAGSSFPTIMGCHFDSGNPIWGPTSVIDVSLAVASGLSPYPNTEPFSGLVIVPSQIKVLLLAP